MNTLPFESKPMVSARLGSALTWLYQCEALWQSDLDTAIRLVARAAGRAMRVDQTGIWVNDAQGQYLVCRAQYQFTDDQFVTPAPLERSRFPVYFETLGSHRLICANDARNDHRTREFLADYLLPYNICSMLDASLRDAGTTCGVICLEQIGTVRLWSRDEQEFATSIADLISQLLVFYRLRDSETRHRMLFDLARDAVMVLEGAIITDCNKSTEHMFRMPREAIIGKMPVELSPPLQPDGRASEDGARDIIQAAYDGVPQIFTWQHRRGDDRTFTAEIVVERIPLGGTPTLQAILRDLTVRNASDHALRLVAQGMIHRGDIVLFEQMVQHLATNMDVAHVMVACVNQDTRTFSTLARTHNGQLADPMTLALTGSVIENILHGQPITLNHCDTIGDADDWFAQQHLSLIVRPIFDSHHQVLGFLGMMDATPFQAGAAYEDILDIFAARAGGELERLASHEKLQAAADTDELTGLPNRRKLLNCLDLAIVDADDEMGTRPALILLDLNRFKEFNDTLGHHVGDQLLVQVAHRLKPVAARHDAVLARAGGDEFALMVPGIGPVDEASALARCVHAALEMPFDVAGTTMNLGGCIGIAVYPDHGVDGHALMRCADVAMYHAKSNINSQAVYDPQHDIHSSRRLRLITDLNRAITERQLVLHFQPKINLHNGRCVGCEALLRWQHPAFGTVSPVEFIPLAESSELIHPLSLLVIDMALEQLRTWEDNRLDLTIAVNLSARNLIDEDFPDTLARMLEHKGISPDRLEVEITESALITDPQRALDVARRIAELGVKLSIDDFGTGYSSLAYLRRLPLSALKIDRSFVMDMDSNDQDAIIVRSTINLAHNLGLKVVAEGVEHERTMETLTQLGCDLAQGYHISRPMAASAFEDWLWRQMQGWQPNLF